MKLLIFHVFSAHTMHIIVASVSHIQLVAMLRLKRVANSNTVVSIADPSHIVVAGDPIEGSPSKIALNFLLRCVEYNHRDKGDDTAFL